MEPSLGWKIYMLLNQDGLMMIGLYSEIARKHEKNYKLRLII